VFLDTDAHFWQKMRPLSLKATVCRQKKEKVDLGSGEDILIREGFGARTSSKSEQSLS